MNSMIKRILSGLMICMLLGSVSSPIMAFAFEDQELLESSTLAEAVTDDVGDTKIPLVGFDEINGYASFSFKNESRGTTEPSSKWDWSKGAYYVSGSSNSATLYTNYYFTGVVGRTFNFGAGSANRITVDLVHKGWIVQTVVSTWTIDAGSSKSVTIKKSDLAGKSESGNYYFRFNSNPLGNSYSVNGSFN